MPSKSIWNNGVVLSFDLEISELRKHYSIKSPENAYRDIKKFLLSNGFIHLKDSDYSHNKLNKLKTSILIKQFISQNNWFPLSVKKVIISPNIESLDITAYVKTLAKQHFKKKVPRDK